MKAALVVLSLVSALTACGSGDAGNRAAPNGGPVEGFPVTIENCGRTLTFDAPPTRVVTGYVPALETLIAIGAQDAVIGRARFDDQGEGEGFLPGHEEIYDAIPEISETGDLPTKEEMLALGADLVISSGNSTYDPANGGATVEELQASGTQVFQTGGYCSAETVNEYQLEDSIEDIRDLGEIFGVQEEAESVAAELETLLADVDERVGDLEPIRVIAADPVDGVFSVLGKGIGTTLIERAGGVNIFADADFYAEVNVEEVIAADAQAYAVLDYLPTTTDERITAIQAAAPDSAGVREELFIVVPSPVVHPGYRTILFVAEMAQALHPEAFDA